MEQDEHMTKQERRELRQQEKREEELQRHHSRLIKKWTKILIMFFVALSIGGLVWYSATRPTTPTDELLSIKTDDWIKGNKDAQVTLVEYLDFECEACGAYYPLVKRLSEEYNDRVRFVIRYFPLPGHKNGLPAALAAEAAGKQEKYWEMYDMLFENQKSWGEKLSPDPSIFEGYAQELGLDLVKFKQDVNSQEVRNRVERDKSSGVKLGIQGTPSFFLNGKKIENPRGYDDFNALIQLAVDKVQ